MPLIERVMDTTIEYIRLIQRPVRWQWIGYDQPDGRVSVHYGRCSALRSHTLREEWC